MVALNGFLLLRTQVFIIDRVVGRGPFACKPALADLSADVAERLLPRLMEMQRGSPKSWSPRPRPPGSGGWPGPRRRRPGGRPGRSVGDPAAPVRRAGRTGVRSPGPRTRRPEARATAWSRRPPGAAAVGDRRASPDALDLERRWAGVRGRMEAAAEVLARRGSIASRLTGGGLRVYSVRYAAPGERRQQGDLPRPGRRVGAPGPRPDRGLSRARAAGTRGRGGGPVHGRQRRPPRRLLATRRRGPTCTGEP